MHSAHPPAPPLPCNTTPPRNQPEIGQFNLIMLARAFIAAGLMEEEEAAGALRAYADALTSHYNAVMARKLGLRAYDRELAGDLFKLMYDDAGGLQCGRRPAGGGE